MNPPAGCQRCRFRPCVCSARELEKRVQKVVESEKKKTDPCAYCGFMNMVCKCKA